MRQLINDEGINQYDAVRAAYDKARELVKQRNPDKTELENLLATLDKNPHGVEWLKLEASDYDAVCKTARRKAERSRIDGHLNLVSTLHELLEPPDEDEGLAPLNNLPETHEIENIYSELEFEPKAASREKSFTAPDFEYMESLRRLQKSGYERHLLPIEAFSLIMQGMEGKLPADLQGVYENINSNDEWWLSMALERTKEGLIIYTNPTGLVPRGFKHAKKKFGYSSKLEIKVNIQENKDECHPLKELGEEFVQFVYGRKFDELPEEIKANAKVIMRRKGQAWPAAAFGHSIGCAWYAASMGVRKKANKIITASSNPFPLPE